jgi:beta-barrel assembly-enhancing protease
MAVSAIYFDGQTARDRTVTVAVEGANLVFSGEGVPLTHWTIQGLHPIDPPADDQPFRLTHDDQKGARLILRDAEFIAQLVKENSHLKGGYSWTHLKQVLGWTVGGLAAAAALGYAVVAILPQHAAGWLPNSWRDRTGVQVVSSLVGDAKQCHSAEGDAAKSAMIAALAEGNPDLPPLSMEIYDMELLNAFAAPGGKIIFTKGILRSAEVPEEIAGVLAHEMGHVALLHPEAQMIRLAGLQVFLSLITGTDGGNFTGNVAALAAIFQYTREAEREADSFAQTALTNASIDPLGLRSFFEKIQKLEPAKETPEDENVSALEKIGNLFTTHPGTDERIENIKPLPAGQTPIKIMTKEQWTALQNICG